MNKPEIENNYPHTIGYFLSATGRAANYEPQYLETRLVASLEEFYQYLRDLEI